MSVRLNANFYLYFIIYFLRLSFFKNLPGNAEIRYWVIQEIRLLKSLHIETTLSANGYALFVSLFLNVFSSEKKSVFLLARKSNWVLHLSLCSRKYVFAGFLETLIWNILFKANSRETIFFNNVFHIRKEIPCHCPALTRLPSFKNRYFVDLLTCVWKNFGKNQTIKNG